MDAYKNMLNKSEEGLTVFLAMLEYNTISKAKELSTTNIYTKEFAQIMQ